MTVTKHALITRPNQPDVRLFLFRVERGVYRWRTDMGQGYRGLEVDYLSESDAVVAIRIMVDNSVDYVGCDLTINPVAPPAEERAAFRVLNEIKLARVLNEDAYSQDEIASIIRNETAIDKLTASINILIAYEIQRLLQPKPPGLDMTHAGLLLDVVEALERSQSVDLSQVKAKLKQPVDTVKIYSSLPPEVKPS